MKSSILLNSISKEIVCNLKLTENQNRLRKVCQKARVDCMKQKAPYKNTKTKIDCMLNTKMACVMAATTKN